MSSYLLLRFFKFLGVALLFAGTVGTFSAKDLDARRTWAELHAAPGFVLTWMVGLAVATTTGVNPMVSWVVIAALSSTVSLLAVLTQAHLVERRHLGLSVLAAAGFLAALASMVWKP
ncbi:MAG: hypothetical protein Q8L14_32460 [Myxococcales bacterium]|nr:hypothetical protein [Myxococcales bacterium]